MVSLERLLQDSKNNIEILDTKNEQLSQQILNLQKIEKDLGRRLACQYADSLAKETLSERRIEDIQHSLEEVEIRSVRMVKESNSLSIQLEDSLSNIDISEGKIVKLKTKIVSIQAEQQSDRTIHAQESAALVTSYEEKILSLKNELEIERQAHQETHNSNRDKHSKHIEISQSKYNELIEKNKKVIAEYINVEEVIWKEKETALAVSVSLQGKFDEIDSKHSMYRMEAREESAALQVSLIFSGL